MNIYVIFDRETTKITRSYKKSTGWQFDIFKSIATAKSAMTRKKLDVTKFDIAEFDYFKKNIEKTETRINLMSGKPFEQPVNTPLYCDPSTETYWSM